MSNTNSAVEILEKNVEETVKEIINKSMGGDYETVGKKIENIEYLITEKISADKIDDLEKSIQEIEGKVERLQKTVKEEGDTLKENVLKLKELPIICSSNQESIQKLEKQLSEIQQNNIKELRDDVKRSNSALDDCATKSSNIKELCDQNSKQLSGLENIVSATRRRTEELQKKFDSVQQTMNNFKIQINDNPVNKPKFVYGFLCILLLMNILIVILNFI